MTIRDFRGGLDTSSDIGVIADNAFSAFKNASADKSGRLSIEPAPVVRREVDNQCYKAYRYQSDGKFRMLLFAWESDANKLRYFDEDGVGSEVLIHTGTTRPVDEPFVPSSIALSDRNVYIADPYGPLAVYFPNVPDDLAIEAGVDPPASTPIPVVSNPGVLSSIGKSTPYFEWRLTYYTVTNIESNPAPSTGIMEGIDSKRAEFTIPNPNTAFGRLLVAKGFIYRRGGDSVNWIRVGEVVFEDPDVPGYATSETFTDNTRELDLGTTIMPTNNYKPPTGLDILYIHKGRMFAASSRGYGTSESPVRVWVSAQNQLEVFGREDTGSATEGGYIPLPGGDEDNIRAISSTGSIVIIGRRRSVYAIFGSNLSNFALSPRGPNIGVAGRDAMCRAYNEVYFLGTDRRVYRVSESDPIWVSESIQDTLDSLWYTSISNAKLRFADGCLLLVFGGNAVDDAPRCFRYFMKEGTPKHWSEVDFGYASILNVESVPFFTSDLSAPVDDDPDDPRVSGADVLLFVAADEIANPAPASNGAYVVEAFSGGITGQSFHLKKEFVEDGEEGYATLKGVSVYVEGAFEAVGGPPGLQLKVTADAVELTTTLTESASIAPLANFRLPGHIVGKKLGIELVGNGIASLDMRVVRLDYYKVRSKF